MRFALFPATVLVFLLSTNQHSRAGEIELFNGRDLSGWEVPSGDGKFRVEGGEIVGSNPRPKKRGGRNTFLCTRTEYANFILTFEFKADQGLNSGVQFRSHHHPADTTIVAAGKRKVIPAARVYGYQYEIDTAGKSQSASIYDEGTGRGWLDQGQENPQARGAQKSGDWNEGRIECAGTSIKTFLNGVLVSSIDDDFSPRGVIALQIHMGTRQGAEIRWRNIRLRELSDAGDISSGEDEMTSIESDPDLPRIDVIRDHGPSAVEWVLSPLNELIPGNIRQNITYLREDLLDEAADAPKSNPAAYALATKYCDKILVSLQHRENARVKAGYRAAQADADIKVSNAQLDARRNYKMSWPQYHREQAQRAALREQEINRADLKKARSSLEWMALAKKMRSVLDDDYRQLREAMRN